MSAKALQPICSTLDPEVADTLFFPAKQDHFLEAKKLCRECPMRQECFAMAQRLAAQSRITALDSQCGVFGVWGGVLFVGNKTRDRVPMKGRPTRIS